MKLKDLMVAGAVVALHVSEWRPRTRILPGELGLEDSGEVKRALALGSHKLADAEDFEELSEVVRKAKKAVERCSLAFPMIPGARYVPTEKLEGLVFELKRYQEAAGEAADVLVSRRDSIMSRQLAVIQEALSVPLRGDSERLYRALARIREEYPVASEMRRRFSLRWQVFTLDSVDNATVASLSGEAEEVQSILRGMVEGLRSDVAENLSGILTTVQRGGKVQARTIETALGVLDRVDSLNILGDDLLSTQTAKLRAALYQLRSGLGEMVVLPGLVEVKEALAGDMDQAVLAAERAFTAVGNRKLAVG